MTNMKDHDHEPKSKVADRVGSLIKYASYPLGLVTGGLTMDVVLRGNMYKNFIKRGFFTKKILPANPEGVKNEADQVYQQAVYDTLIKEENSGRKLSAVSESFAYEYEKAHQIPSSRVKPARIIDASAVAEGETLSEKLGVLVNKKYRGEVREFFEDIGMKGPRDYWKSVTRNQKVESAVLGFTVAAITIGAMLAISDHRGILAKLMPDKDQGETKAVR